MNRILIVFYFLLSAPYCFGQFEYISWNWNDTLLSQQQLLWNNGRLRVENKEVDGQLVRFQYYSDGQLHLNAEIQQSRFIDTVITFDPENYSEKHKYHKNFGEGPWGKYTEYHPNGNLKEQGKKLGKTNIGFWVYHFPNGKIEKSINFNEDGRMDGEYIAYYPNGQIKEIGNYKVHIAIKKSTTFDPETYEKKIADEEIKTTIKSGIWKYYLEDGSLEKETDHSP